MTEQQKALIIKRIEALNKSTDAWLENIKKAKSDTTRNHCEYVLKMFACEKNGIQFTLNVIGYEWDYNPDGSIFIREKEED